MMGSRSSSNNNSRINSNSSMATTLRGLAASTEVGRLVKEKQRRLVEVPYTASVAESLRAMQAHNILAVPVAAPPGHWIGAGGSSIVQSDASTGHALKQYIGIVSTLDILLHLSELHPDRAAGHRHPSPDANLATGGIIGSNSSFHRQEKEKAKEKEEEELLARPISSLIGHSLEGLSLWSLSSHTSVLEAMEPMSKGIHRALVAIESPPSDHGVETDISSPGYAMLTQTDLIRFLHEAMAFLARSAGYGSDSLGSRSVESLGVVRSDVYGVPATMPLVDVLKCMSSRALTAVAVVDVQQNEELSRKAELIPARHHKILATFSASDFRGFSAEVYRAWRWKSILHVVKRARWMRKFSRVGSSIHGSSTTLSAPACNLAGSGEFWMRTLDVAEEESSSVDDEQVTCWMSSPLEEVMKKALDERVHRIWVVEKGTTNVLIGLVTFSDILGAILHACK